MKKNITIIGLILLCLVIFGNFSYAQAALPDWLTNPFGFFQAPAGAIQDVNSGLELLINGIITVAEIIFIVMVLIGGIMYLTSAGNEETAKKSRALLIGSIIGLVITLAAWPVSTWVLDTLKSGDVSPLITPGANGSGYNPATTTSPGELPNPYSSPIPDPDTNTTDSAKTQCLQKCDTAYVNAGINCQNLYQQNDQDYKACVEYITKIKNNCVLQCNQGTLSNI